MVAAATLRSYIKSCDEVLSSGDRSVASTLEKEIVSVFQFDFQGLTRGLDRYGPGVLDERHTIDFMGDIRLLRARLQKELDAIEPKIEEDNVTERSKKIFISHATKDKDYVAAIIRLLESLGFREDEIICSSIPPYCIPLDNNVYAWLVNEFQHCDLHMIYVLSRTYYSRPACLNEMGAAWAMQQKGTTILLPGFEYHEIAGCIDSLQIGIKLDDEDQDMLLFRLGELKDALISEFGLRVVNGFLWEKKRGEFLENIRAVMQRKAEEIEDSEADEPEADHILVVGKYDVGFIPTDSAFLLVYADAGDGHIKKIKTLGSYAQVTTSGKQFMADNSHKESARWVEALDRLISWGWVKPVGSKGEIFELTGTGHRKAEWLKERMSINTDNEPQEEIKRFDV